MKQILFPVIVFYCAFFCVGCRQSSSDKTKFSTPEKVEASVFRMPDYHRFDSVTVGTTLYTYDILRLASDSLPSVTYENGEEAKDNTIRLILTRNGRTYFGHTFTKSTFSSALDEDFYSRSILDGIRFVSAEAGRGLTFFFSVSEPNSDMTVPFSLTVGDDGAYTFERTEIMDLEGI